MTTPIRLLPPLLGLLLGLSACASAPSSLPPPSDAIAARVVLAGLSFEPHAEWVSEALTSNFRVAQYRIPNAEGETAEVVVYHFGPGGAGNMSDNFDRWRGQFRTAAGDSVEGEVEHSAVEGLMIHALDLSGTWVGETAPGSGEREHRPDFRMIAVVIGTDAGFYYIKALGPKALLDRWEPAWRTFLGSMRPAPADPPRSVLRSAPGPAPTRG